MKRLLMLLVLAAPLVAPPVAAQSFVIEGPALRAEFAAVDNAPLPGQRVELRTLRNKLVPLADVLMATNSGGWTLRLERTPVAPGPIPPWMDVSSDGSVVQSNPGAPVGSLTSLALTSLIVEPDNSGFAAQWLVQATLDGVPASIALTTAWDLVTGKPSLDTTAAFVISGAAPSWHVHLLRHPQLRVLEFEGATTDQLVLPFSEGVLIENPTEGAAGADGNLIPPAAQRPDSQPMQVSAYWDGAAPSRCVFVHPTEVGRSWHELHVQAVAGAPGVVSFEYEHLPPDIFLTSGWGLPAPMRVGVIAGDWWDVAALYRGFLAADPVTSTWYRGPVGSPNNPMPQNVKDLVAEVFLFNNYNGDNLDLFARQALDLYRMLGSNVLATYYGGHAPDRFGHWFLAGGYLPGRPSLAAAVREGQKQWKHLVMPYFSSTAVADCADPAAGASTCATNPVLAMAQTAVIRDDGLRPTFLPEPTPPRSLALSPRSAWWADFMPDTANSIATFTDSAALYLDFFLTRPDFDPVYDPATEPPPGGGDYPFTGRLQQAQAIHAEQGQDFLVTMEFLNGAFSGEVDLMHADPAAMLLSVGTGQGPTGPVQVTMPNAKVVPFFRAVHDNVKLARIMGGNAYGEPSQRAWVECLSTLTYGRIPSLSWSFSEIDSPITQRFPFASYIGLLGGPTDGNFPFGDGFPFGDLTCVGPCEDGPPPGGSPFEGIDVLQSLCDWKPKKHFPFHREMTGLTGALRDFGVRIWHNGTIDRLPNYSVTVPPGFTGAATNDPNPADAVVPFTPSYIESLPNNARYLVPGMFRAPSDGDFLTAGSLLFMLVNPWVNPENPATMAASFTFEPTKYGWTNSTKYSVLGVQNGLPVSLVPNTKGPYTQNGLSMPPGDFRWWVFRKL